MISDQELLHILSQSNDAVAVYDSPQLHIRFANNAMLAFWGCDKSIIGTTLLSAIPELQHQPFLSLLAEVWHTGNTYRATDTPATLLIDGKLKTSYFDFEYRAIRNEKGEVTAILHTASDVSSRVLAQQQLLEHQKSQAELLSRSTVSNKNLQDANSSLSAINQDLTISAASISKLNERLQESESDFKRLVEQAPVAIMVFRGKDLIIEIANQLMLDILGKDASVLGHPILESMPELKGEPAVELIFEAYRSGKEFDGKEVPVRMLRNGIFETRYFNFSYRPLLDNGTIIGVMDLAVEVTDQVMARIQLEAILSEQNILEKNLRANESRLQSILDTMAEGVLICDNLGNTVYANQMAQQILNVSEKHFIAHGFFHPFWKNQRIDGTTLSKEKHPLLSALATGKSVFAQEIGIVIPERDKIYISLNAAPLFDDNGKVAGCTLTFTDVTSRIKLLQQKDDFISVASHELKTPMTSLKASLQVLERLVPLEDTKDTLGLLVNQANRSMNKLSDLVNMLLNSNRISEGRFPLYKTPFDIVTLVKECCSHITSIAQHRLTITGINSQVIYADEQLIEQVIVNLLSNAVKYAPHTEEIKIDISSTDDCARVCVTDSGPGIAADKKQYVFERYFRADQSSSSVPGLGLGLYITAEIIRKHNGDIGVESELGRGSAFWFTLPLK